MNPIKLLARVVAERTLDWARGRVPRVGDPAPDFSLHRLGCQDRVRLSSFRGVRPVLLIFGSYT